jgi:hypothetical protein
MLHCRIGYRPTLAAEESRSPRATVSAHREAVILGEDRLLGRLGIDFGRQQCFQSLDSLFEFLDRFFQQLIFFGERSNGFRLLSDLQIPWIGRSCCGVNAAALFSQSPIVQATSGKPR